MKVKEYLLSTNKFEKPKEFKNNDAVCLYLMRLLLLDPGSIQSKPNMGVGLVTKWRYSEEDQMQSLSLEIQKQISDYLPQFQFSNVITRLENKSIVVEIDLNDVRYSFITTEDGDLKLYQI